MSAITAAPNRSPQQTRAIESALIRGDLVGLTAEQRLDYYHSVCETVGLNPLTSPFAYIVLNGKLTLYALKGCTDQLRKIHGVTIEIISRDIVNGVLLVHVRATMPAGKGKRSDEDFGAVSLANLQGEAMCNAILKAITKAKRRVTLSICGLGMLDETEVPSGAIPFEEPRQPAPASLPAPEPITTPALAASTVVAPTPVPFPPKPITGDQITRIAQLEMELGLSEEQIRARLMGLFGKVIVKDLYEDEAAKVIVLMEARLAQVKASKATDAVPAGAA